MTCDDEPDIFDDSDEPLQAVVGYSERERAWVKLINQIGDDFSTSEFARLGADDIERIGLGWCQKLPDVGADQVNMLYGRIIRSRDNNFPPNIADFAAEWNLYLREMYQAERESRWNHAGNQGQQKGYGDKMPDVCIQWRQRFEKRLGMVSCNCTYPDGTPCGAKLVNLNNEYDTMLNNPTHWVCALNKCNFRLAIEHTLEAPQAKSGALAETIQNQIGVEDVQEAPKVKPLRLTAFEKVVVAWNIDTDAASEMELMKLRAFVNYWVAANGADNLPTPDDYMAHQETQHAEVA